jgi:hypothetical protein
MTVGVTWDAIDASQYSRAGEFTVFGTVEGTDKKALATVMVEPTIDYLNSLKEKASAISNENRIYTEESYQALQKALKVVEDLGTIDNDAELNTAVEALQSAIDDLVSIPISHDNLATLTKEFISEYGAPGADGIINSLVKKLENSKKASEKGNGEEAKELLDSYIDEVSSHSGKKVTNEHAKVLIWWAEKLLAE